MPDNRYADGQVTVSYRQLSQMDDLMAQSDGWVKGWMERLKERWVCDHMEDDWVRQQGQVGLRGYIFKLKGRRSSGLG